MSIDLQGRRAVVTGAASGFGKAISLKLLNSGASVVATDVDDDGLTQLGDEAASDSLRTHRLDVGDAQAWNALVSDHGPFDLAVLNAGVATHHIRPEGALPVLGLDAERYRTVLSANIDGVVFGTQAVLDHMTTTGFGDIIVTASVAGLVPIAPDPVYGLTKHAVVGFVRSLAAALDQHVEPLDVHISAICPGFADTAILTDESKTNLQSLGVELLTADRVADTMIRAIEARKNGAQWVVWGGYEDEEYEWNQIRPLIPTHISGDQ
jgi:NAD(P)-dependent dehydrogenase (short-subunit alcohol dehydrogenase family)